MLGIETGLRVRLFDGSLSSPTLVEELTERLSAFSFGTKAPGGYAEARGAIEMPLEEAWQWLATPELPGRFFYRLAAHEEQTLYWEGRIMEVELVAEGVVLKQSAANLRNAVTPVVGGVSGTEQTDATSLALYPRRELRLDLPAGTPSGAQADAASTMAAERGTPVQSQTFTVGGPASIRQGIQFTALGYWSSCRDQFYSTAIAGSTDWTTGGPHTLDDIVKEVLDDQCPGIDSDQAGIEALSRDLEGIDLSDYHYAQEWIRDLLTLSDSDNAVAHFFVWEDRKPYLTKRNVSSIDWRLRRSSPGSIFKATGGRLEQAQRWRARAGQVVQFDDLVPVSRSSPSPDLQRTFFIAETHYDAIRDELSITPDSPTRRFTAVLPRLGSLERKT